MRRPTKMTAIAALLAAGPAMAQDLPGDPYRGERLASDVCSACHVIDPGEYGYSPAGAPSFQDLADNPELGPIALRVLLATPHREMPDLILDREETDNVVSYILSLK